MVDLLEPVGTTQRAYLSLPGFHLLFTHINPLSVVRSKPGLTPTFNVFVWS